MTVLSVNFNKINVERKEAPSGKISINNNIALKDIEKLDLSAGTTKQGGLKFKFELVAKYEPNFAEMNILGNVVYLDTAAKIKAIMDGWKKNKNIQKEVFEQVMNSASAKANIQALMISQSVNLPPPIKLPRFQVIQQQPQKSTK